jgi:phosphoglycolate phosphatase
MARPGRAVDSAVALATDLAETADAFDRRPTLTVPPSIPASGGRFAGAVIAFDLDGALVHTAPDLMGALNALLAEEGLPPLPMTAAPSIVGKGARVMIERGFAAAGAPLDPDRTAGLFDRYIALYLGRIADESRAFEGAIEAMDALAAEGATLAICTNKRTDLAVALLDALDLTHRFAAIVGADLAPKPKPDGSHLLHAIALAGGDPKRALMIGDSINDVLAARSAGIPMVLVSFGYTDTPPAEMDRDVLIDRFDELYDAALQLIPAF